MKSFKKQILVFIILLIGSFFIGIDNVNAGELNWAGVKIECIYEDGGSYTSVNKSTESTKYVCSNGEEKWFKNERCDDFTEPVEITTTTVSYDTTRTTYNLHGVSAQDNSITGNIEYINDAFVTSTHRCKKWLRRGYVSEESDGITQTTTYYKFDDDKSDTKFEEDDFEDVGWWADLWGAKDADEKAEEASDTDKTFALVSERYIITEEAGEPDFTLTYIQESDQPTGSSSFAYLMFFGDIMILKTANKTTAVINDGAVKHFKDVSVNAKGEVSGLENGDVIYLNNPEAKTTIDSSSLAAYYYETDQIRYTITTSASDSNSRKYILFNTGLGKPDVPNDELCDDIMPQTSKILKEVIKYAQIIVPILMIGLTGLDIGKIVVTGNIDEELPKQKKKIMARLIVGIVFFFLPLVTMLVIDLIKDSGAVNSDSVKQIECLFK